jgi:anti-anti-sigma factor
VRDERVGPVAADQISVSFEGATVFRVRVTGEVDAEEARELRRILCDLVGVRGRVVLVELAVEFFGSSGVAALIAAFDLSVTSGSMFRVSEMSIGVRRVLRLLELDQAFTGGTTN